MIRPLPAPTFGHAAEAFVVAHEAPGARAKGTAVKYRQTLFAIGGQLADAALGSAADVAVLGTPAGWPATRPPGGPGRRSPSTPPGR
jgi:hypothetical protein